MIDSNPYLFVYGTLLNDENEFAIYLKQHGVFYSDGKFNGRLYNIGEYPGAVLQTGEDELVYGIVFKIDDPAVVFQKLDDYEGFGDNQSQPYEFIRELIGVETDSGGLRCWIYLYNLPVDALQQIISGRFL